MTRNNTEGILRKRLESSENLSPNHLPRIKNNFHLLLLIFLSTISVNTAFNFGPILNGFGSFPPNPNQFPNQLIPESSQSSPKFFGGNQNQFPNQFIRGPSQSSPKFFGGNQNIGPPISTSPPRCSPGSGPSPSPYGNFISILNLNSFCLSRKDRCRSDANQQGICPLGMFCCNYWCGGICVPSGNPNGGKKSYSGSNIGGIGGVINPELIPQARPPHWMNPNFNKNFNDVNTGIKFPYPPLPPSKKDYTFKPPPPPTNFPTILPGRCRCYEGQFDCNNGQCIPGSKVCDKVQDCSNALDELAMFCPKIQPTPPPKFPTFSRCLIGQFACQYSDKCLPAEFVCNGIKDCPNGDDEIPERCFKKPPPKMPQCFPNQFQCADGSCIPGEYVCDGKNDCKFGKDELPQYCKNRPNPQPPGQDCDKGFRCKNGQCVRPNAQCDCNYDCMDGSDEDPSLCKRGDIWIIKCTQVQKPIRLF
ncbi:SCO-spondin-like [Gordionus sp. m RMFG-2023]|uniref:SCO-spondin-like n=1 Tax=Gordionus sp. m RMFG-2023 TaxID=3053472 RepID=UPI0031FD03F9